MNPSDAPDHPFLDRALKPLWAATAMGAVVVISISWWTPNVAPIMPGSGVLGEEGDPLVSTPTTNPSTSFVNRPLFMTNRRAAEKVDADIAIVKQATESIAVQQITGATLLGVFASGDVSEGNAAFGQVRGHLRSCDLLTSAAVRSGRGGGYD